jgi:Kdo2-lipid IVA lauroyltransferase/acyltransferase
MVAEWLVRVVLAVLARLPLRAALGVARGLTRVLDAAIPRFRRAAERNLQIAGYGARPDLIDSLFGHIARMLVTFARFPRMNRENISDWIRYEGLEHYERAKAAGRGVLFATAHLGNWELSAFAHGLMTEPMHVVVRPLDNARLDRLVERRRTLSGNRVIGKKDSARGLLKALRANEAVGVLVDQNATLNEGVFVDLFGVPACTNAGFAKLAHHSGAAVIPGFALWSEKERRYVLRFCAPVEMTGDVAADTQRLQSVIEGVIREYPDQWLWIHRRWKTRPPGEPALYS